MGARSVFLSSDYAFHLTVARPMPIMLLVLFGSFMPWIIALPYLCTRLSDIAKASAEHRLARLGKTNAITSASANTLTSHLNCSCYVLYLSYSAITVIQIYTMLAEPFDKLRYLQGSFFASYSAAP